LIEFLKPRYITGFGTRKAYINSHEKLRERFTNAQNNLDMLVNKIELGELIAIHQSRYVIYSHHITKPTSIKTTFQIYIQDLFSKTFEQLCHAELSVELQKLEIVNLDTEKAYQREGFGKIMLQCIEGYCTDNKIERISGRYYNGTPIGLENLIRFYTANGYTDIEGKRFEKYAPF
jgi:GNAT superfamily N-acetyltransferase